MSGLPPPGIVHFVATFRVVHVDERDGAFAAVRDVQALRVAAEVQAVRALAGRNEADVLERLAVDHEDAVAHHVGDVEDAAVGRQPHVLRHRRRFGSFSLPSDLARLDVHLEELAGELAATRSR